MASRRGVLISIATLTATGVLRTGKAAAQHGFPNRTVRVIVPFPAGSALDTITRLVGENLSARWGAPVVIENISGGGGNMGTARFARSEPDGYTLLAAPPGPIAINKALYKDTSYDATKFAPLSLLATVPNVLVARNDLPANFEAFLSYVRANPGKINYGSQGVGSTGFLTARMLELQAKLDMVHVPYRGAAPILADIAAGHIDLFFDTVTTSLPLHQSGKARILAVADQERSPALPEVPTIAELVPGFRSITWFAFAAPEGTPSDLATKISSDIAAIIQSPSVNARLREWQMTPRGTSPSESGAFFDAERQQWTKLIREIGLEPQ